ncbi:hypothetical protein BYT27DRAFT_6740987 [Phlegmacium glaucopus]|nr:hypothetical protein BYT27DRAFT_6740987 [Phlegmacium glaucopus]
MIRKYHSLIKLDTLLNFLYISSLLSFFHSGLGVVVVRNIHVLKSLVGQGVGVSTSSQSTQKITETGPGRNESIERYDCNKKAKACR